jgi:hypothetical protein
MITKQKDPDEDLDYTWDFAAVLGTGETIADHEFIVPAALTLHDEARTTTAVTAYVSPGGTLSASYEVTCRITTDATPPRIFDRSIRFKMTAF